MSAPPDPWQCQTCHRVYVVRSLARDCETQHENETRPMADEKEGGAA